MKLEWLLLIVATVALAGCTQPLESSPTISPSTNGPAQSSSPEPISPIPLTVDLDARKVALGSVLFADPQLSHDDTVACATCHHLDTGGVDHLAHSVGINGAVGGRNAPTVFNSGLNFRQFWDGRAPTLEDQIDGPTAAPREMGSTWTEIIRKLDASPAYVTSFTGLYGGGITSTAVKDAIATFERSLNTPNSRFDQFLRGDATAITRAEADGYAEFKSFGCVSCHQGTNVGGNMYQRFGVMEQLGPSTSLAADPGRFKVTGDERDLHTFKVPSLRNVALTAPYFHDGSVTTLEGAVVIMGRYQLGRQLTSAEVEPLVAFLKTLTGEYDGQPLQ
jgi:cytochrome c peroxidase